MNWRELFFDLEIEADPLLCWRLMALVSLLSLGPVKSVNGFCPFCHSLIQGNGAFARSGSSERDDGMEEQPPSRYFPQIN